MTLAAAAAFLGGSLTIAGILAAARPGVLSTLALIPAVLSAGAAWRLYASIARSGSRRFDTLMRLHHSTLEVLSLAIDARDPAIRGHVRKVQACALELARSMEVPPGEADALRTAAILHDIGTVVIPDRILAKPGKLSETEFRRVRAHPAVAVEILAGIDFPVPVMPIIRHHHEHWDGSGYPDGLKGTGIPEGARILAVADAFEALTSDRAHRRRKSSEEACALIEAWSEIHYDPRVVRALRANLSAVEEAGRAAESVPDTGVPALEAALRDSSFEEDTPAPDTYPDDLEWLLPEGGSSGESGTGTGVGALFAGIPSRAVDRAPRAPSDDTSSAQREVYALYEIAQALGSSMRLSEVLDLVVSKIGQLVPYRTCAFFILDEGGETISARHVSGAGAAAMRGHVVRVGDGITGWAAAHRSYRLSTSPEPDLAGTTLKPADYSAVAAFPLCRDAETLGVISLYFPKDVPCTDDHLRVMDIIAKLATGAVHNSTLLPRNQEPALTDGLTFLPNERHLRLVFEQERIRSQQACLPAALLEMDLEGLRAINERHGNAVGDRYLAEVARVLRSQLRERDVLVRLSADEFAAILPLTGFAAAALLAERLQKSVDHFTLKLDGGRTARCGLSIGIALYPQDGESFEDILSRADQNMRRNKEVRKNAREARSPNVIPFPIQSPGGEA